MKWMKIFLITVILFLTPSQHIYQVFAQTPPPPPAAGFTEIIDSGPESPCGGNGTAVPGEICHINPDTTDKTVRIGQSTKSCWYVRNKTTGVQEEVCLAPGTNVTHSYNIEYRPGGGYTRPDHQWKADMVRIADPKLTSQIIKDATIDFTNEQYESDRGRTCYFDDQGNMVKNEVSETIYILALKYVPNLVQHSKRFSTFWALDKRDHQNYEEPTERISKSIRPCGFSVNAAPGPEKVTSSLGRVIFNLFQLIQQVITAAFGDPIKSNAVITNSKRNPKIEDISSKGPGVIVADMDLSPINGAAKYADKPGFIETFRPGLVKYRPPEVNAQVKDNPFIGTFDQNDTNVYLDNLVECGYQHLCQTLWPAVNEPDICKYKPEIPCGQPTPTGTVSPSVCQTAEEYGIPCCQLQGIMEIETETGKTMGSESCEGTNFSCCNGDVCGPAQIKCGDYKSVAGKDTPDLCTPEGSAVLLSRLMHLKLCQAAKVCTDSYDWIQYGNAAMKFPIKDYTAAGYFYGMEQGCVASGCTQYRWGPGKTYCSGVQYFCENNGATPPDDGPYPEFCPACSEEYVNAGQNPIDCSQ